MKYVLERLKLGTFMLSGLALIVLGAAGYATFAEVTHACPTDVKSTQYIADTFMAAKEK